MSTIKYGHSDLLQGLHPIDEERFGNKSLRKINEVTSLKLCWDLLHSTLQ